MHFTIKENKYYLTLNTEALLKLNSLELSKFLLVSNCISVVVVLGDYQPAICGNGDGSSG